MGERQAGSVDDNGEVEVGQEDVGDRGYQAHPLVKPPLQVGVG